MEARVRSFPPFPPSKLGMHFSEDGVMLAILVWDI
jgi:hypothetical protein